MKKPFQLTRTSAGEMCEKAGLKPVFRGETRGYQVYIADGYSDRPERDFQRFGVEPGKYLLGCYATAWFVGAGEEKIEIGSIICEEPLDNVHLDKETRQKNRISKALVEAAAFIDNRNRMREDKNGFAI